MGGDITSSRIHICNFILNLRKFLLNILNHLKNIPKAIFYSSVLDHLSTNAISGKDLNSIHILDTIARQKILIMTPRRKESEWRWTSKKLTLYRIHLWMFYRIRRQLWDQITTLSSGWNGPYMVIGDFSAVLGVSI